jgi:hypothetical protein
MAITYKGHGSAVRAQSHTYSAPTRAAGDLLVLLATARTTAAVNESLSGWRYLGLFTVSASSSSRVAAYIRIATNTSADNLSSAACFGSGSTNHIISMIVAEGDVPSDVDEVQFISQKAEGTSQTTNFTIPGITPTEDGAFLVFGAAKDKSSDEDSYTVNAAGSPWTLRDWNKSSGGAIFSAFGTFDQSTAAAVSSAQITISTSYSDRFVGVALAFYPESGPLDPTPDEDWDFLVQIADDYADLPGEAPDAPDPGWGPKAWLPNTLTAGTWVEIRGINGTTVADFTERGLVAFSGDAPYEIEARIWDGEIWETPFEVEFDFAMFGGVLRDNFSGTNGSTLEGREPTNGTGTWTVDKLTTGSADPTGGVTIQNNRLSSAIVNAGAVYNIETVNFNFAVDWVVNNSADVANIAVRRTGQNDYLLLNIRRSQGDIRLQRRIAGAFSVPALIDETFQWSDNVSYRITGALLLNDLTFTIEHDGGIAEFNATVTTNQDSSATYFGLFSGGSALPTRFDNVEVYQLSLGGVDQEVSTDKSVYEPGETVTLFISPENETPNSVTINGVSYSLESGATAGEASVILPSVANFLDGDDDANDIPWYQPVAVTLGFPTANSLSAFIEIEGPEGNESGSEYWHGVITPAQAGNGIFESLEVDDSYLVRVTQGTITGITEAGVVQGPKPWAIRLYRFAS